METCTPSPSGATWGCTRKDGTQYMRKAEHMLNDPPGELFPKGPYTAIPLNDLADFKESCAR